MGILQDIADWFLDMAPQQRWGFLALVVGAVGVIWLMKRWMDY